MHIGLLLSLLNVATTSEPNAGNRGRSRKKQRFDRQQAHQSRCKAFMTNLFSTQNHHHGSQPASLPATQRTNRQNTQKANNANQPATNQPASQEAFKQIYRPPANPQPLERAGGKGEINNLIKLQLFFWD